jgi:hypothetical protein
MVITPPNLYFHNLIMFEWTLDWSAPCFTVYKDQLMALGIIPGDPDSAAKAFADTKTELDNEKTAEKAAQIDAKTLAWTVKDLNISAHKFAAQIPTLENQVKYLEKKWWMG